MSEELSIDSGQTRTIHLDNHFMINMSDRQSREARLIRSWQYEGVILTVSALAWTEFKRNDPKHPRTPLHEVLVLDALNGGIASFGEKEAEVASQLFNKLNRPRMENEKKRMDCLIAAVAITAGAELASYDKGFNEFLPHDLRLVHEINETEP